MTDSRESGVVRKGGIGTPRAGLLSILMVCAMLAGAGLMCPAALWVLLREGPFAVFIVLAGLGLGRALVPFFGLGELPASWRLVASVALGLGTLSLLVLGIGCAGLLQRSVWTFAFMAILALLGVAQIIAEVLRRALPECEADQRERACLPATYLIDIAGGRDRWLWLCLIPTGAIALVAATMPPGTLWPGEGNGYDVLEYHLAVPREYLEFEAQPCKVGVSNRTCHFTPRIGFLPHNVYSNFPFNIEMLYLLTMVLRGDPVKAAFSAQLVNALLGVLAVAAVWLGARRFGRTSAMVAALGVASCPFLTYLSGLAYVENGMLFFTAVALAAMVRAEDAREQRPIRWMMFSGAMGGFAAGCKYLAAPQVLVPLALAAVLIGRRRRIGVAKAGAAFIVAGLLVFSPWLLKNAVMTGNPVFPLGRCVFHERAGVWDDDAAARWREGHLPGPEHRSIGGRFSRLWGEVICNERFGPIVGLAIIAAIVLRVRVAGRAELAACGLLAAACVVSWLGFTHLVDRFAVVMIVPAAWVLGVWAQNWSWNRLALRGIVVLLVGVNLALVIHLCADARLFEVCSLRQGDGIDWFTRGEWPGQEHVPKLNKLVANGSRVLMVADARRFYLDPGVDYCVVFNRNPFAEAAAARTPNELIAWLREKGYSYVFVHWGEMRRMRRSRYGFWGSIDEGLFERMQSVGLRPVENFAVQENGRPYGTLFEVPGS